MAIFIDLLDKLADKEVDRGVIFDQKKVVDHKNKVLTHMFVEVVDDRRHQLLDGPLPIRQTLQRRS